MFSCCYSSILIMLHFTLKHGVFSLTPRAPSQIVTHYELTCVFSWEHFPRVLCIPIFKLKLPLTTLHELKMLVYAARSQWMSTHQHTIHWMPVIIQL
jgi:hypothetical protein